MTGCRMRCATHAAEKSLVGTYKGLCYQRQYSDTRGKAWCSPKVLEYKCNTTYSYEKGHLYYRFAQDSLQTNVNGVKIQAPGFVEDK